MNSDDFSQSQDRLTTDANRDGALSQGDLEHLRVKSLCEYLIGLICDQIQGQGLDPLVFGVKILHDYLGGLLE